MHYLVISDADPRGLILTLRALDRAKTAASHVTAILRENIFSRFHEADVRSQIPDSAEQIWLGGQDSLHRAALGVARRLPPEAGAIAMLRSGSILRSGAEQELTRELLAAPDGAVLWSLSRNRQINDLSKAELQSAEPWGLLPPDLRSDPFSAMLQARCLRPCLFALSQATATRSDFEQFSTLSDWYAYRRFALHAEPKLDLPEKMSPLLGYIGALPDRRASEEQARNLTRELHEMALGYPEFQPDVARDIRTLVRLHLGYLAQPTRARRAARFLRGMFYESRAQSRLLKRIKSDAIN